MAEKPPRPGIPLALELAFTPGTILGSQRCQPSRYMSGLVPLPEPLSPSKGYSEAKAKIERRSESSSIIELLEIIPDVFAHVDAMELLTSDARPGCSRHVRCYTKRSREIFSLHSVRSEEQLSLHEETHMTQLLIRRKPKHPEDLGIFDFFPVANGRASGAGSLNLVDSIMIYSKSQLFVRGGATDDELLIVMDKISALFAIALTSRIGALTLLPNAAMFEQAAEKAEREFLQGARNFSIILADIDGLKGLNHKHGYAAGDCILAEIADRLRNEMAALGHRGSVVFRPGKSKSLHSLRGEGEAGVNPLLKHDEFAILLHEPVSAAAEVAHRLKEAVAGKPFRLDMPLMDSVGATCSFGISGSEDFTAAGAKIWRTMLDKCVFALRSAKEQGGDAIQY